MLANSLSVSAVPYYLSGDLKNSLEFSLEACQISQSIGDWWGQLFSQLTAAFVYIEQGEVGKASEACINSARLGQRGGYAMQLSFARTTLAWIYAATGDLERGQVLYRQATVEVEAEDIATGLLRQWHLALLALIEILNGELATAEATIQRGLIGLNMRSPATPAPVFVHLAKGQLAMARKAYVQAVVELDEMLAALKRTGVRIFRADASYLKGKALLAQRPHKADAAWKVLMDARAEAEALGSRRSLWPILLELSAIEGWRGNRTASDELRRAAQEIVKYIAHHTGTPELRASFLALPDVRVVLDTD